MRKPIITWISQSKQATPEQLTRLISQAGQAPFAPDLLEVDESLWGGFWQGDVIAPGYRLPAVELALLRASRLDLAWPEDATVAEFLAALHTAILDPLAGVWTLMAMGEPCVVFASMGEQGLEMGHQPSGVGGRRSATIAWYCVTTGRLHAGYRTAPDMLDFAGAVEQRPLKNAKAVHLTSERRASPLEAAHPSSGPDQPVDQAEPSGSQHLAARLDRAIQRMRTGKIS